ncbi:hypothetical protein [Paraburkholderia sp. SIMBA_054]|uniref:hypothetical protein n=1 Tax=Paraburkholderia sp. SIMBA_054 TaxID=3085795 RepID=UPI00397C6C71
MARHHIEEEESSLFPELRESGVDLVRLGDEIAAQREKLMNKLEMAGSKLVGDNSLTFRQCGCESRTASSCRPPPSPLYSATRSVGLPGENCALR